VDSKPRRMTTQEKSRKVALSVWQRGKIPSSFSFAIQPASIIGRTFFSIYSRNSQERQDSGGKPS
jgi:hypothetical protein